MGFRWIFVYPWKGNVRSVKRQYIRSLKRWYQSNYIASWSEFAKYIGKYNIKPCIPFFYKIWSCFSKRKVSINSHCPWFKFFKWCPKQYVCIYIYIYIYIYVYIYIERLIWVRKSDFILLIKNQNLPKNVGKQNSEIPCDQDWWKFCWRMIWNHCLLWVCCSNHTEKNDLRDVMVQGKTIQFTVFKRLIRFFLTIRVRKSRLSSHINILC